MEASLGSDEARAAFARLRRFRMAKCGFIFAPLVLSVMPTLRFLQGTSPFSLPFARSTYAWQSLVSSLADGDVGGGEARAVLRG